MAKTDSTAIEAEIKSKIIRLATPLVPDHLFNQLCLGYSKEPHAAFDHIQQTYNDAEGNTIFSLEYDYYTQILAASRPFMDQEILSVSVCQAFINGLDSCLIPGFRTYFPNYRKSQDHAAIHQHKVLEEMHQAALCAKMEYNNIRAIASKVYCFGGQAFSAKVNTSQAERTIKRYSSGDNTGSNKSSVSSRVPLHCYGCGGLHLWSLLENGIHVIKCPNANNPGILDNTKKVIERIRNKRKKKQQDFTMRKHLATTNYNNFNKAGKEQIRPQVILSPSLPKVRASLHRSLMSLVLYLRISHAKKDQKRIIFLYDAKALSSDIQYPVVLVTIQSVMPHIQLQLGADINDSSCPSIRCVVDTAAAFCNGNNHFYLTIAKWFPQCVAKIFLPEDYSPIILSGIAQDNSNAITTDLPVAFQFHLP